MSHKNCFDRIDRRVCRAGLASAPGIIVGRLVTLALATSVVPALAQLPTGGNVSAGKGAIATNGTGMVVTQSSDRMSINWQSFSIGKGNSVTFRQPSTTAVALNRVLGSDASTIQGTLHSNGQVFLLNPNGVLFSPTAQVNVGGLVASTLNLSDKDFLAGRYTFAGNSAASVTNQGTIQATNGGAVALIAARIVNSGSIDAPAGAVLLGSGSKVTLDFGGPVKLQVDAGALQSQIDQGGAIRADGGVVYLTARAADSLTGSVINHTGITEARTLTTGKQGQILLLGDMQNGTVNVGGTLDASAPNGDNGGSIETSAAKVQVADNAQITTSAADGETGTWLIDPNDYTIAATGGDMTGAALSTALGSSNVNIQSSNGATAGNGDVFVNDTVTWSANTLTLSAQRNIEINSTLNGSGTAGLALEYGQGAVAAGNTADYYVNAPVNLASTGSFSTKLGSDGTAVNYTIITALGAAGSTTGTDLQGMNGNLSGHYVLGLDIDASATSGWNSGAGFVAVGNNTTKFTGTFDGLGHTISGLTINRPTASAQGLFGITSGASLRDVGLNNVDITAYYQVGGLVGFNDNYSTVSNSYVTGIVSANTDVGGLVGINWYYSTISSSYAAAGVSGKIDVGGLVGLNSNSTISSSYASGAVFGSSAYAGGLVGFFSGGSVSNCYAIGAVSGVNEVGGLTGYNGTGAALNNTYATGKVTGSSYVGGLVGWNLSSSVTNSYWDIDTTGQVSSGAGTGIRSQMSVGAYYASTYTGFDFTNTWFIVSAETRPFLRMEHSATITNAHQLQLMDLNLGASYSLANNIDLAQALTNPSDMWRGSLSGSSFQGSFVAIGDSSSSTSFSGTFAGLGHTIDGLTINRPYGSYQGLSAFYYQGLFGVTSGATIRDVGLTNVDITSYQIVGALVGWATNNSTVSNSYATGTVTGSYQVGGLIGENDNSAIKNSYAASTVSGDLYVGGLVGSNNASTISKSYATGAVSGNSGGLGVVGGLAGWNGYSAINDSYATGTVTDNSGRYYAGGLVGRNYSSSITDSYATGVVSGSTDVGGLIGGNDSSSTVSGSYATGAVTGGFAGGLVGESSNSDISSSYATGGVIGNGGLVGVLTNSTIKSSYATGDVTGGQQVGGLVGYSDTSSVDDSYAIGAVTGSQQVGGLVGDNSASTVNNSYATGSVSGNTTYPDYLGGLIGSNEANSTVSNSYATGPVTGYSDVGGLVGENKQSSISGSYAVGIVNGTTNNVGGLAGLNYNSSTIISSYATGAVSGGDETGGLVGFNSTSSISNSYATGAVSGGYYVGGLAGENLDSTISNSSAAGVVIGNLHIGGLVGDSGSSATINNSYATGAVTGGDQVGGLAGSTSGGFISSSYATGAVSGNTYIGGLVGFNNATVKDTYATGAVVGDTDVGGLVGKSYSSAISDSYAAGAVSGSTYTGGLIGENVTSTVSNSFWDIQTSGQTTSAGGQGKTTAEMQSLATFAGAGWNIDDKGGTGETWRIYDGQTYPLLRSFLTPVTVTANNDTKIYNGVAYRGGNGYSLSDPNAPLLGSASYSGSSQGAVDAGTYTIIPAGFYSNQQGYDIISADGSLTINPAPLVVTANNDIKVYDNTAYSGGNGVRYTGFASGDDASVLAGTLGYSGTSQGAVDVGHYTIVPGGLTASNYSISYVNGTLSIIFRKVLTPIWGAIGSFYHQIGLLSDFGAVGRESPAFGGMPRLFSVNIVARNVPVREGATVGNGAPNASGFVVEEPAVSITDTRAGKAKPSNGRVLLHIRGSGIHLPD